MKEVKAPEKPQPTMLDRVGDWCDRAVFALSPVLGAKRMAARLRYRAIDDYVRERGLKLGHPAMRSTPSRDSRWVNSRQTIDEQLVDDRVDLQNRAIEMIQVNPHAAGAVEGRVSHEIGVGLGCRPNVAHDGDGLSKERAQAMNDRLKKVCKHWSMHGVDRRRRLSLSSTQRLACRTYASYGEVFALFRDAPYEGPIGLTCEIINPMRVETPPEFRSDENVSMGVRYHAVTDQIVGYYVRKKRVKFQSYEYEFIRRHNAAGQIQIVHVFEEMFPGQSRGLPWLTAAMAFLKDCDDFHESELISKQVESCFSLIMTGGRDSTSPQEIAEANANREANSKNRMEDIYPGMIHYANDGEDVKVVDPMRPGNTFAPFVEHTLRAAASALNYPYELLAKNFSQVTYSSGRLAMLDGQVGFRIRAQVLIDQLLGPLWMRIVDDAFFYGHMDGLATRVEYLADRHRFEDHTWGGHSFGSVDPEKEAKANKLCLETGQKTEADIHAENDKDWVDIKLQRDAELRKDIELRLAREKYEMDMRKSLGLPEQILVAPDGSPTGSVQDQQSSDNDQPNSMAVAV